jgi:hypothetical protein
MRKMLRCFLKDLETATITASFSCDAAVECCAFAGNCIVLAGDGGTMCVGGGMGAAGIFENLN